MFFDFSLCLGTTEYTRHWLTPRAGVRLLGRFCYTKNMNCDLDCTIPEWIIEHPETTRVFSDLGLDIGCAGKSLRYVCVHQGLSPPEVLERLRTAIATTRSVDQNTR